MENCLITKKRIIDLFETEYLDSKKSTPIFKYSIKISGKIYFIKTLSLQEDFICENGPIDNYISNLICNAIEKKDSRINGIFSWDGYRDESFIKLKVLICELSKENQNLKK